MFREEYWSIDCMLKKGKKKIPCKLSTYKGKKIEIKNEKNANEIIRNLKKEILKELKKEKR